MDPAMNPRLTARAGITLGPNPGPTARAGITLGPNPGLKAQPGVRVALGTAGITVRPRTARMAALPRTAAITARASGGMTPAIWMSVGRPKLPRDERHPVDQMISGGTTGQ